MYIMKVIILVIYCDSQIKYIVRGALRMKNVGYKPQLYKYLYNNRIASWHL